MKKLNQMLFIYNKRACIVLLNLLIFTFTSTLQAQHTKESQLSPFEINIQEEINVKKKVKIDLYVMSQCPFAIQTEQEIIPILRKYKDKLDFNLFFIGGVDDNGTFISMHGEKEVRENLIQLAIANKYPDKLFDYLTKKHSKNAASRQEILFDLGIEKIDVNDKSLHDLYLRNLIHTSKKGYTNSPTLVINGKVFDNQMLKSSGSCPGVWIIERTAGKNSDSESDRADNNADWSIIAAYTTSNSGLTANASAQVDALFSDNCEAGTNISESFSCNADGFIINATNDGKEKINEHCSAGVTANVTGGAGNGTTRSVTYSISAAASIDDDVVINVAAEGDVFSMDIENVGGDNSHSISISSSASWECKCYCGEDEIPSDELDEWGCCDQEAYKLDEEICCGGELFDADVYGCCNEVAYDLDNYDCCNDLHIYNINTHKCCDEGDENAGVQLKGTDCNPVASGSGASYRGSERNIMEDNQMQFQDLSLNLSPNPTNGRFNLLIDIPKSSIISVQVFDIYGRIVFNEQAYALRGVFHKKIQLPDSLSEGTYFIKVSNNEKFVSKKILLMK